MFARVLLLSCIIAVFTPTLACALPADDNEERFKAEYAHACELLAAEKFHELWG